MYNIGILSYQGGFFEIHHLLSFYNGIEIQYVKNKTDLGKVNALIIPGGESTTIMKCINNSDIKESLIEFIENKPVYGICAGLILLSQKICNYNALDNVVNSLQ